MASTTAIVAMMMMILTTVVMPAAAAQGFCPVGVLDKCEVSMVNFPRGDHEAPEYQPCCSQMSSVEDLDLATCICSSLQTFGFLNYIVNGYMMNYFLKDCHRSVPSSFICSPFDRSAAK